jgi:hypothetical protein
MKSKAPQNDIIIYEGDDGALRIEVNVRDETVWLSQKQMAELFDCSVDNVSLHMKNIFKEGELSENAVTEESSITASDDKDYLVKHYNLDANMKISPQYGITKAWKTLMRSVKSGL